MYGARKGDKVEFIKNGKEYYVLFKKTEQNTVFYYLGETMQDDKPIKARFSEIKYIHNPAPRVFTEKQRDYNKINYINISFRIKRGTELADFLKQFDTDKLGDKSEFIRKALSEYIRIGGF